jgi:hypothetical protein
MNREKSKLVKSISRVCDPNSAVIVFSTRPVGHCVAVRMSKIIKAWRTVKAVETRKGAKALA